MCVSMLFVYVVYVMESLSVFHMSGGLDTVDTHVAREEVCKEATGVVLGFLCRGFILQLGGGGGGAFNREVNLPH